ncbi:MAG: hypothetical protein GY734_06920, partial [Herbaspirillum sp.]|nr:hypothetical protein [Herbaspirillum sp.]
SDADTSTGRTAVTTLSPGENDVTWDAGCYLQRASIGDYVWNDANMNGIRDGDEAGFPGVLVRLLNDQGNHVATAYTDTNGNYSFTNLAPGNYSVEFTAPGGYMFTYRDQGGNDGTDSDADPSGRTVSTNLTAGENDITWDAGLCRLAGIGDLVWHDLNGNGVRDDGEGGIPGVPVKLFDNFGNEIASMLTNANGNYNFLDIPPGNYYVSFTAPEGYRFSPQDQGGNDADDSDVNPVNGQSNLTFLEPGENDITWDAGLYQPASIGDVAWHDLDADGIRDSGENGIPGCTVILYDSNDNPVTTTTDSNGLYSFANLPPGSYHLKFITPDGYKQSPADQGGDDTADSDAAEDTGETVVTILSSGENDTSWDAGIYQPASIGDLVWNDFNYNGIKDDDENGINDITVKLYKDADMDGIAEPGNDDGEPVLLTITGNDDNGNPGYYNFENLTPGEYFVVFVTPSDYAVTWPDQGSDDTVDNDAEQSTGQTSVTTLISDENDTSWDAGIYNPASIGDFVWDDSDYNGIKDEDETGINNVKVQLYRDIDNDGIPEPELNDGHPVSTTITADGNNGEPGYYNFDGLPPGNYFLVFTTLPNYSPTLQDQGENDTLDSDPDSDTLTTSVTSLIAGENDITWDAGFYRTSSVGDLVWNDSNYNGIKDDDETGINQVTVKLYRDVDGDGIPEPEGDDGTPADTAITADDADGNPGFYNFDDLAPGNYFLVFTSPEGMALTHFNNSEDDTADSDADPATSATSVISLETGEHDTTWDAGFYYTASLGNYVWNDGDLNGIQDDGETGVNGVAVSLYRDADNDGISEPDGEDGSYVKLTLTANTTGAIPGYYSFTGLAPGSYFVVFHTPEGYSLTLQDQDADNTADSDADPETGRTAVTVLDVGENDITWDAGLYGTANLGNYVWYDEDYDGIQDDDESGINGVTVKLFTDTDGDGIAEPGSDDGVPVAEIVTADDKDGNPGYYSFSGMAPGRYFMVFSTLQDYDFTLQNYGNNAIDSDIDPETGYTDVTTLNIGENDTSWDAGYYHLASIGNYVWNDVNADGIQESGESGINDVTVMLYRDTDGDGIAEPDSDDGRYAAITQTGDDGTGNQGYYSFNDLTPGSYFMVFIKPDGYSFTQQDQGSDDGVDSDVNPNLSRTSVTVLEAWENDLTWDAGLYEKCSIGDFVWHDTYQDGVQEDGEPGISGVTVKLINPDTGEVLLTKVTDDSGYYEFINLTPGDYAVEFELPEGYSFTDQDQGVDDAGDSDADITTGRTETVTLLAGENDLTVDAGMITPSLADLGDFVWYDADQDGVQGSGEQGISGVTVKLINPATGAVLRTSATDGSGYYGFGSLVPGDYAVEFELLSGYSFTGQNQGSDDAADSDADVSTGRTDTVTLSVGENNLTVDAGMYSPTPPASLGDFVWLDTDENGIQDVGEPGISDVTVNLRDADTDKVVSATATDSSGYYVFTGLSPDDYVVEFELPEEYSFTGQDQGTDDSADSDADTTTGRTETITLSAGEDNLTVDAGMTTSPLAAL